jgi:hypothetical protein
VTEPTSASWELVLTDRADPFEYLPRAWMYEAPVPRTKGESVAPRLHCSGLVEVAGQRVNLDNWIGMLGHNWGSEHAERWIWMQGAGFEEDPDAVFDVVLGRIRIGRVLVPWVANGFIETGGQRTRLGGPRAIRGTEIEETPELCRFTIPGKGVTVRGRFTAPREDIVAWVYSDPDGHAHNTANCSIADLEIQVNPDDGPATRLTSRAAAAYELGMRETDHGLTVQPFSDP